jgi:ligand-binding sensor domain-containing protein/signal transduction histidine kinase
LKRFFSFLVFQVFLITLCCGQSRQYLFSYIGKKDGLHHENVQSVQQDKKGFLWIASDRGIQRYDGTRFVNFVHSEHDPASIPAGNINSILIDKKDRLWMLSSRFVMGYMDLATFAFHPVKIFLPPSDKRKHSFVLHIDKDDHIMLISPGKTFFTYNETKNEVAEQYNPFRLPEGWEPLFFWQDHERNYWIGSHLGLLKYNPSNKLMSYKGHNAEKDPVIAHFEYLETAVSVYMDKQHTFWVTAWPGNKMVIKSYDIATGVEREWQDKVGKQLKDIYYELHGVTQMSDGSLWMAGYNLFARVDKPGRSIQPILSNAPGEYSIRYDYIRFLYEDREKNIWVCTNKGLFRFNPSAQVFGVIQNRLPGIDSAYSADITDFLQTADGEVMVGSWGPGIFSYDGYFNPVRSRYVSRVDPPGEGMVWCMIQLRNGDIWRGVQHGYLFVYDARTRKNTKLQPAVFEKSTIRQIAEDKNGNVWFGTQKGFVIKWNATEQQFILCQKLGAIITRVLVDDQNHVWVCTDQNGVFMINASDGSILSAYNASLPPGRGLLGIGASDIIQYNDSIMVIASEGLNVLNLKHQTFKYFTEQDGLTTNVISNLVRDRQGYIWMSSSSGIMSYHPINKKLSTYNEADGVHSTSFNSGASATLRDGRILFGTNHDFIVFDPSRVTVTNYQTPRPEITGLQLMNKPLLVDSVSRLSVLTLPPEGHSLTIQLSTLNHQNIYNMYYMMEGVDDTWQDVDKSNQVVYSHLSPGGYVFKTACRDGQGNFGAVNRLVIKIRAPFWKTWWFYGLLTLLAGTLLFWLDKERLARKASLEKMRSTIADSLHQQVSTTLNNITILSEIAKLKADKDLEKSKEYIEQINEKSRTMMYNMEDMLWSIHPGNDSMEKMLLRMKEFADNYEKEYGLKVGLNVDKKLTRLHLNMKGRQDVLYIFQNIMNCLAKNLLAEKATIALDKEQNKISIKIQAQRSDGPHAEKMVCPYLDNVKERLADLDAVLDIIPDKRTLSVFMLIPVN